MNFYKLTHIGRISTRSSLESPRAPLLRIHAHMRAFRIRFPGAQLRRTTFSRSLFRATTSVPALIMSPTRNRNFVRRDKGCGIGSLGMHAAERPSARKEQREDRSRETRERGTCYFDGHEAEARLHAVTYRSSRGSFRARGSSPTGGRVGLRLPVLRRAETRERERARKRTPSVSTDVLFARLLLSVDLRFCSVRCWRLNDAELPRLEQSSKVREKYAR